MRRVALLLLGLVACADLKTAGEEPTPSADPTTPSATKTTHDDDGDGAEAPTRPSAKNNANGTSNSNGTNNSGAEPIPDGGLEGGPDKGPDGGATYTESATRLCEALCDHASKCAGGDTPFLGSACTAGCLSTHGAAAAHYNKGYRDAVMACFDMLECNEPTSLCLNLAVNANDTHTRQSIQACEAAANHCARTALLLDCDKLGHVDLATQNASQTCTSKPCEDIQPCLAAARGE